MAAISKQVRSMCQLRRLAAKEDGHGSRSIQACKQTCDSSLAAPAFSHERRSSARVERKGRIFNGMHSLLCPKGVQRAHGEHFAQVDRLQNRPGIMACVSSL